MGKKKVENFKKAKKLYEDWARNCSSTTHVFWREEKGLREGPRLPFGSIHKIKEKDKIETLLKIERYLHETLPHEFSGAIYGDFVRLAREMSQVLQVLLPRYSSEVVKAYYGGLLIISNYNLEEVKQVFGGYPGEFNVNQKGLTIFRVRLNGSKICVVENSLPRNRFYPDDVIIAAEKGRGVHSGFYRRFHWMISQKADPEVW